MGCDQLYGIPLKDETMTPTNEHIQWASNTRLARMVEELARRHVDADQETLLVAARRLRAYDFRSIPFNHEAFE